MYYLDFSKHNLVTKKENRQSVRSEMTQSKRDEQMKYKLRLQHNTCFWCGCEINMSGHLDHIQPIYRGGINVSSNLVASCKECNLYKGIDQIEITNPYTIKDYLKLQASFNKWMNKPKEKRIHAYQPKRVQLYGVYRADCFKYI